MPMSPRRSREQYRESAKAWFEQNKEESLLTSLGVWDIASLRFVEDHLSLQVMDGMVAADVSYSDSCDDGFYDKELSLDRCAVDHGTNSSPVTGRMDICLHPIYQVPCPYIIITDARHGTLVSMRDIIHFFDKSNCEKNDKFIQEEHPITFAPAYTLQLCGVYEKFEQICNDVTASNNKNIQNIIYFNSFLSLIVEAVGLNVRCTNLK